MDQLRRYHHKEAIYLPENGIIKMEVASPIMFYDESVLQLVWIGRMDENKALILLLEALCKIRGEKWHLNIIGDGPLQNRLILFSNQNGIASQITWHGSIPRLQVIEIIKSSHLHVISSLGEATTTVLFEAMACGVPTMSLDHCGIKIPIHNYKQVINDIASQISRLINNPEEINNLSKGVLECSKEFIYQKRICLFEETYEKAINMYKHYKV